MELDFGELIGKNHEELEKKLGFTYYLETRGFEDFRRIDVDHNALVNAFMKFNNGNALSIVKFHDGVIKDFFALPLDEIEKELLLLKNNEGMFCSPDDEELATSFGFFTDDSMAEFMQEIIFFSGKREFVENFSSILTDFKVLHFPPDLIPSLKTKPKIEKSPLKVEKQQKGLRKLGRNEPCHCGSGIKYKKCCLDEDMEETGSAKKVQNE